MVGTPRRRGQHDAALPTADDHHVGLLVVAQPGLFVVPQFEPGLAALVHAVFGALDAVGALLLFKAFELDHGGQQGPGLVSFQAQVAAPARDFGFEAEPGLGHAIGFGGLAFKLEVRRAGLGLARGEHLAHGAVAFLGADVPGEGHQVAPVAVGVEQRQHRIGFSGSQGGPELVQPGLGPLGRRGEGHGSCLLLKPASTRAGGSATQDPCHVADTRKCLICRGHFNKSGCHTPCTCHATG
jgi:hypothetical protein